MEIEKYLAHQHSKFKISEFKTDDTDKFNSKNEAAEILEENVKKMSELQDKLYAQDKYSLLLIFQAMDAAGKDGTIKHVMSGLNPQSTQVYSFKQPSAEEIDHGYLWRISKALPERGRIGIFNRSHYEEVLIVRVHNLIASSKLPEKFIDKNIWQRRFEHITNFEKYLYENGTVILKFFLHISKEEQKKRFLERIDNPAKNWKFAMGDIEERKYWDEYQKCYEEAIAATSKDCSPWFIIPADKKWFARLLVSEIIVETLKKLKPEYPELTDEQNKEILNAKNILTGEKNN